MFIDKGKLVMVPVGVGGAGVFVLAYGLAD